MRKQPIEAEVEDKTVFQYFHILEVDFSVILKHLVSDSDDLYIADVVIIATGVFFLNILSLK